MARLINKTQGFTIVNNHILKNKKLSLKARGLMATLLSLPDGWDFSVRGLTVILPDGRDAIAAACKELEKEGYLQRVQAKDESGKYRGYDWIINDTPVLSEKPLSEKPLSGSPLTEKPSSEKPSQYNKHQSNTKELNNHVINPSFIPSIDRTEKKESCREELQVLMGYEMLSDPISMDLFELCVEMCDTDEDIYINKKRIPNSIFQSKIKKLYYEDLIRIAEQIKLQKHKIKNIKNYMLSALYNEAVISNTYYTNQINVDGV